MAGRTRSFLTTRRLALGTALFALFVAFDIALFAYLIFDSLSQRELEKVVLETREIGEPVAAVLATNAETYGDLALSLSVRVTMGYLDDVVARRDWVRTVEIRDASGAVIYRAEAAAIEPRAGGDLGVPEVTTDDAQHIDGLVPPGHALEEVEVPIGDFGVLVLGVSRDELLTRIARLRRDLIQQASAIGILTLLLLAVAFVAVWVLFRRGRVLEEQAREGERLAYIGTLASGLAHEIRNPLNALSLNIQMLEEDNVGAGAGVAAAVGGTATATPSATGRLLAITHSEIKRLERLVSDFLSYAKPRQLALEEVPAIELLEGVRAVLSAETRARGAEVTVTDRSLGAEVRVDREQIRQLLLNLSQNAMQATERSGRAPEIHLRARNAGQLLAIEVEDNGIGIDEAAKAKMFEIFFSTRRGGTGLGLAIVQRIAKDHGGRVEVDSTPGVGTTVRVLLPRVGARETTTQTLTLPVLDRS